MQDLPNLLFQDPTEGCYNLFRLKEIELKKNYEEIMQMKKKKEEEEENSIYSESSSTKSNRDMNGNKIKKSTFTRKSFSELCKELDTLRESWESDEKDIGRDVIKLVNEKRSEKDSQIVNNSTVNQFQNINPRYYF
jgi:hypothetical protein